MNFLRKLPALVAIVAIAGCSTAGNNAKHPAVAPVTTSSGTVTPSSPVTATSQATTVPKVEEKVTVPTTTKKAEAPKTAMVRPELPYGEFALLVESTPLGGTVVVNGIPVGRAPQRVVLPGTPRGFFREQVSVKVRFIGNGADQASQTTEQLFTPLEKIPAIVRFTPTGTSRVGR